MTDSDATLASVFKRTLCKHFCARERCNSRCSAFYINESSYKVESISHYLKEGKKREIRTGRPRRSHGFAR